ncbi:MAG: hypothetical protein VR72_02945 [Clostridiaceae bacterium BRH_c20a]|nr:MAG: hypothetical protein VR72_02945 [Clostridiaceae bacterium BRH_c20a]
MAKKNKSGRKPKWDELDMPSKLNSVKGWAMNGSTDEEICKMLGISHDTFYKWKREKTEFAEAIKKGKFISNGELLNAAFKQSIGFTFKEEMAFKVKSFEMVNGKAIPVEKLEVIEVAKFALPNPTMNIFMLKNRLPEEYKDKHNVEHSGEIGLKRLEDFFK